MTAPTLLAFFNAVYLLALAAWVGSIAFFSFGVAPIVFRVLGPEAGAKFGRALFPRYYLWGSMSAAIALPARGVRADDLPRASRAGRGHPGPLRHRGRPRDALLRQLAHARHQRGQGRRA